MVNVIRIFALSVILCGLASAQPITKNGGACTIPGFINSNGDLPGNYGTTYQPSMSVQNSVNCMTVPSGFTVSAWAHEGNTPANGGLGITAIQEFDFDEQGRMLAIDSRDYPCNLGRNSDRVIRLADTDGNGAADQLTVVSSGVTLLQGITKVPGGFVVVNPQIQFRNDAGGGASTWASPFDGGGGRDTHGGSGSLVYNLDNNIYGSNGYNSPGPRVWRINALGGTHTYVSFSTTPCNNAHGAGITEDGDIMASAANGCPAFHAGMLGQAVVNFGGDPAYPFATNDYDQWDFVGRFTAASNASTYTARLMNWSTATQRRMFVCEGTMHGCSMWTINRNGATWSGARSGTTAATGNIMVGADAWVAPIWAKTGPDGAVWVADWYNRLFLHNPATPACGNAAYGSPLRNKTANRIYRVYSGTPTAPLNLSTASEAQRIAALNNNNLHWRIMAQQLLITGGATTILLDALENILRNSNAQDAIDNDPQVTHALWVLQGLNQFSTNAARWAPVFNNADGQSVLRHSADAVVMNALKALSTTNTNGNINSQALADAIRATCVTAHPNAAVRLQAFLALTRTPAPAGGAAYTNGSTGTFVSTAYGQAGTGKVSTGAAACTFSARVGVPILGGNRSQPPRSDLRFHLTRDGFELKANGWLGSGDLTVYDLRGHIVFRSTFNQKTMTWSEAKAENLKHPIYLYAYREYSGDTFKGKLTMSEAF